MFRSVILLAGCLFVGGCAALVPAGSVISPVLGPAPPLQVTEHTGITLSQNNFVLVKTNVVGWSKGFSLLGLITICPATLTEAMNRLYASAQMRLGSPQTLAHLTLDRSSTYWILFGIPKIEVHADIVQFVAKAKTGEPDDSTPAPTRPPEPGRRERSSRLSSRPDG
jgi:hypothetical protein